MPRDGDPLLTVGSANTVGTFTWTVGNKPGTCGVTFSATNSLTGTRTTTIRVVEQDPGVSPPPGNVASGGGGMSETTTLGARGDGNIVGRGGTAGVLALSGAFPNPTAGEVEFALDVPKASEVSWAVFDLQGRMLWSEERSVPAGRTALRWDGFTSTGERAATGVYLVRVRSAGTVFGRRIVRL